MTLHDFMRNAGWTDQKLANILDVDRSSVTRWRNGNCPPPLWAAVIIETLSKGAVRPREFFDHVEPAA